MTYQSGPTEEERDRAKQILEKIGGVCDIEDKRITDEEAHILAMVVMGTPRGPAAEMVAIARGHIPGDVLTGYDDEDKETG